MQSESESQDLAWCQTSRLKIIQNLIPFFPQYPFNLTKMNIMHTCSWFYLIMDILIHIHKYIRDRVEKGTKKKFFQPNTKMLFFAFFSKWEALLYIVRLLTWHLPDKKNENGMWFSVYGEKILLCDINFKHKIFCVSLLKRKGEWEEWGMERKGALWQFIGLLYYAGHLSDIIWIWWSPLLNGCLM